MLSNRLKGPRTDKGATTPSDFSISFRIYTRFNQRQKEIGGTEVVTEPGQKNEDYAEGVWGAPRDAPPTVDVRTREAVQGKWCRLCNGQRAQRLSHRSQSSRPRCKCCLGLVRTRSFWSRSFSAQQTAAGWPKACRRPAELAGSTDWRHRRRRLLERSASTTPIDRQATRGGTGLIDEAAGDAQLGRTSEGPTCRNVGPATEMSKGWQYKSSKRSEFKLVVLLRVPEPSHAGSRRTRRRRQLRSCQ